MTKTTAATATAPAADPPSDGWVDDAELGRRTPISSNTWAVWRARGKGPPFYKAGRRVFYKWTEVLAWLETKRTAPEAVEGKDPARVKRAKPKAS